MILNKILMRGNLFKNISQILFISCNFDIFTENVINKKIIENYSYFFLKIYDFFSVKKHLIVKK